RLRLVRLRKEQQYLVREVDDEGDDPDGRQDGQPHQDARDEIAPQAPAPFRSAHRRRLRVAAFFGFGRAAGRLAGATGRRRALPVGLLSAGFESALVSTGLASVLAGLE